MTPTQRQGKKFTTIAVRRAGHNWEDNAGRRRKLVWIHISAGYVYIAYGAGRMYWVLANISRATRPRISFVDATLTMRINSVRVRFTKPADLEFARACLGSFSRRE